MALSGLTNQGIRLTSLWYHIQYQYEAIAGRDRHECFLYVPGPEVLRSC